MAKLSSINKIIKELNSLIDIIKEEKNLKKL